MTERKEHFDKDTDLRVSPKLSADLKALFEPQIGVPPVVDRAVMDRAYKHIVPLQSGKRRRLRFHWGWRIAAAAAVIIIAFSLDLSKQSGTTKDQFSQSKIQPVDIDGLYFAL